MGVVSDFKPALAIFLAIFIFGCASEPSKDPFELGALTPANPGSAAFSSQGDWTFDKEEMLEQRQVMNKSGSYTSILRLNATLRANEEIDEMVSTIACDKIGNIDADSKDLGVSVRINGKDYPQELLTGDHELAVLVFYPNGQDLETTCKISVLSSDPAHTIIKTVTIKHD